MKGEAVVQLSGGKTRPSARAESGRPRQNTSAITMRFMGRSRNTVISNILHCNLWPLNCCEYWIKCRDLFIFWKPFQCAGPLASPSRAEQEARVRTSEKKRFPE